jgi:hypothetical protein
MNRRAWAVVMQNGVARPPVGGALTAMPHQRPSNSGHQPHFDILYLQSMYGKGHLIPMSGQYPPPSPAASSSISPAKEYKSVVNVRVWRGQGPLLSCSVQHLAFLILKGNADIPGKFIAALRGGHLDAKVETDWFDGSPKQVDHRATDVGITAEKIELSPKGAWNEIDVDADAGANRLIDGGQCAVDIKGPGAEIEVVIDPDETLRVGKIVELPGHLKEGGAVLGAHIDEPVLRDPQPLGNTDIGVILETLAAADHRHVDDVDAKIPQVFGLVFQKGVFVERTAVDVGFSGEHETRLGLKVRGDPNPVIAAPVSAATMACGVTQGR